MQIEQSHQRVALIASFGPDHFNLVSQFVTHYRKCGVTDFYLNLHFDTKFPEESHRQYLSSANALLAQHEISVFSTYCKPFDAMAIRSHHEGIQNEIAQKFTWIVWADIDEFHEFPQSLGKLTEIMEANGFDYVKGSFVDRMARSGFPEVQPERSLWEQFPIGTDMTKSILRGVTDKVMLSRSSVFVIPGHHDVVPGSEAKPYPGSYSVHHFKWDASVVVRLKRRLEKEWRERCSWWVQSARALQWLESTNGEPLSGLRRYDFMDDEMRNGGGPFSGNIKYKSANVR